MAKASGFFLLTGSLRKVRFAHAAWASPKGVLLIGGGLRLPAELLTDDGATTTSFINSRM